MDINRSSIKKNDYSSTQQQQQQQQQQHQHQQHEQTTSKQYNNINNSDINNININNNSSTKLFNDNNQKQFTDIITNNQFKKANCDETFNTNHKNLNNCVAVNNLVSQKLKNLNNINKSDNNDIHNDIDEDTTYSTLNYDIINDRNDIDKNEIISNDGNIVNDCHSNRSQEDLTSRKHNDESILYDHINLIDPTSTISSINDRNIVDHNNEDDDDGDDNKFCNNYKNLDQNKYNDYINQTYSDLSRRQSIQNDIESQSDQVHLIINNSSSLSSTKSIDNNCKNTINNDDELNEEHPNNDNNMAKPFLTFYEKNNEKRPKSIVKSPSSHSFSNHGFKKVKKNRNRLSLHGINDHRSNDDGGDSDNDCSSKSPEYERPVLHVQFMSQHLNNPSASSIGSEHRSVECKSPVGSIGSQSGRANGVGLSGNRSTCSSSSASTSSSDDDASSIGQYSEVRAPDGGWGWVVVFASFMVNMIADGITFSFGVIFVEFLKYFGEGKGKTAWIGSLFMAIPLLSGPIASFLTDRYGCRKVTIAGSILACLGFVLSAFANSMEMLFFTFGILAGFGLSLCYVAAVVIVAYYFEKKRSFATGLSVCGSGIGTFVFAPLIQILLEAYGWRGTTLILAGIFLNMTVCGMLMRDLEWTTHRAKLRAKERKRSKLGISADSFSVSNSTNTGGTSNNLHQQAGCGGSASGLGPGADGFNFTTEFEGLKPEDLDDPRLFSSLVTLPTFIKNGEKVPLEVLELLATHRNVHKILLQNYPTLLHSRSFSEPYSSRSGMSPEGPISPTVQENSMPKKSSVKDKTHSNTEQFRNEQVLLAWLRKNAGNNQRDIRQPPATAYLKDLRMHRHSLTYRGAMLNINRYRLRASSCPDIYRNSMTTIAKEKTTWYQVMNEFKTLLVDILDFSYFSDIRFLLFALSNFLLYTWYDVPYVYLTDNAISLGIEETDASILIGVIGIVNMFGEIALGWVGDVKGVSASLIYAVCMTLCGVVTAMVPLSHSYMWLCSISGLFGLFIAANYALTSIILVELITLERFTNAYGLLLLVQGIANLVGPPLAGWIYDVTGTYDLSFYIAGFFISISGIILFIVPALGKYRKYRALKRQNPSYHEDTPKISTVRPESPVNKCNGTTILTDCFNKELLKETVKGNHV